MPAARSPRIRRTLARRITRDETAADFEALHYERITLDARRQCLEGEEIARRTRAVIAHSRQVVRDVGTSIKRSEATRSKDLFDDV